MGIRSQNVNIFKFVFPSYLAAGYPNLEILISKSDSVHKLRPLRSGLGDLGSKMKALIFNIINAAVASSGGHAARRMARRCALKEYE